jgi:biopolymer transport protein ExbB
MDISYVFRNGDVVLIGVFCILLLLSVLAWYYIITRGIRVWRFRQNTRNFLTRFWESGNWLDASRIAQTETKVPLAQIADAGLGALKHYRHHTNTILTESCTLDEFLVRAIRNAMNQESAKLETGLTILASAGSTAPFIGLFGTVWGIYHALVNIAAKGNATLETVAGPMGEALIATAAGLAVAVPAVLAYNALVRANRVLLNEMDSFAHDLHAQLLTGADKITKALAQEDSTGNQPTKILKSV